MAGPFFAEEVVRLLIGNAGKGHVADTPGQQEGPLAPIVDLLPFPNPANRHDPSR
jgi:hypothetical protein